MINRSLKHSKGEWVQTGAYGHLVATDSSEYLHGFEELIKDPFFIIAECYVSGPGLRDSNPQKFDEERRANARLMSAAPDMLELLLDIYETMNLETKKRFNAVIEKAVGG